MANYDLFNGDADGLCALQQLRLSNPIEAQLVTGIKREINLFERITAQAGDVITALDVSFDKNRDGVRRAVDAGARVFYADHHYAGETIEDDNLELHIDTDANTCTSLIINHYLEDRYYSWAIAGAYGDNLNSSAEAVADRFTVSPNDRQALKQLGICLNYNGYGFSVEDLFYHPAELFKLLQPYTDPLDFIHTDAFKNLLLAYKSDIAKTERLKPVAEQVNGAVFVLPARPWARRVNGVFSNDLAHRHPSRAHAVLVECENDCYRVSVRAPLNNKTGADELCRQFETGGGRKAAAGINSLPAVEMERFKSLFFQSF